MKHFTNEHTERLVLVSSILTNGVRTHQQGHLALNEGLLLQSLFGLGLGVDSLGFRCRKLSVDLLDPFAKLGQLKDKTKDCYRNFVSHPCTKGEAVLPTRALTKHLQKMRDAMDHGTNSVSGPGFSKTKVGPLAFYRGESERACRDL